MNYIIWYILLVARQVCKTTIWKMFLEWKKHIYLSLDVYNLQDIETTKDFLDYFKIYEWIDLLKYDYLFFDDVKSFQNRGNILKWFVDNYDKKILCSSSGNVNIVKFIAQNLTWRYDNCSGVSIGFLRIFEMIWWTAF